jgi:hypothetical protein
MKKKIVIWVLGLILVTLGIIATGMGILYVKQKQITQWAVEKINEGVEGHLEITKSNISLTHHFPFLDLNLQGVKFYASEKSNDKPIYQIDNLYLGFRLFDLLQSKFDIKLLEIKGGYVDLIQFKNGDLNLLLAKNIKSGTTTSESTSSLDIHLKKLIVEDFNVSFLQPDSNSYQCHIASTHLSLQSLGGDIELSAKSTLIFTWLRKAKPTFFHDKHFSFTADLWFDSKKRKLTIQESHIGLEDAKFFAEGSVTFTASPWLDLAIKGEKPDFTLFMALAPPEAASIIRQYSNQGNVFFEGTIRGETSNGKQPAIDFKFGCSDGLIENIKANKAIDQLGFRGSFTNGKSRSLSSSRFELVNFSFRPSRGTFKGNLTVHDFTNPQVALTVMSDLDLDFLADFLQLDQVEDLKGYVQLKMNFNELVDIEKPENSLVKLKEGIESELIVENLSFKVPDQDLNVTRFNAHAEMKGGKLTLDSLSIHIGNSDIRLNGSISDLPSLFHRHNKDVDIRLHASGKKIVLRELLSFDTALSKTIQEELLDYEAKLGFVTSVSQLKKSPLPLGEFYIYDLHTSLKKYPHALHDLRADMIVTDSSFQLKDLSGKIDESDFHFNGQLVNYALWFDSIQRGDTRFEFDFFSKHLKLRNLLTYQGESYLPKDYQDEVLKDLRLHGFTELYFTEDFKSADLLVSKVEAKLRIHPMKIEQLNGRIHYEDKHVTIQNLSAKMGSSDFNINMSFYTGSQPDLKKRNNKFTLQSKFLNLDELLNFDLQKTKTPHDHANAFNIFEVPFTDMVFATSIEKIRHHHVLIQDLKGYARMQQNHFLYFDTLLFKTAGGTLSMNGYFNGSNPKKIYLKSDTRFENLNIDQLLFKFDNFGQDFMISQNLHGQLTGNITSLIRIHPDLTPILTEGEAHLGILVVNGTLNNFAPLQAMSSYFKDRNLNRVRFDTLQNKMHLKNGVLTLPAMTINSSLGFIEIEGTQSLDLNMDYLIRIPLRLVTQVGFRALFGGKNKEEVDPDQVDAIQYRDKDKRVRFLNVRVKGKPDKFDFSLGEK